jgi:hypothetical protein
VGLAVVYAVMQALGYFVHLIEVFFLVILVFNNWKVRPV